MIAWELLMQNSIWAGLAAVGFALLFNVPRRTLFGCTLVVSVEALRQAGVDPAGAPQHQVRVRGKTERLTVYAIDDPRLLLTGASRSSSAKAAP